MQCDSCAQLTAGLQSRFQGVDQNEDEDGLEEPPEVEELMNEMGETGGR